MKEKIKKRVQQELRKRGLTPVQWVVGLLTVAVTLKAIYAWVCIGLFEDAREMVGEMAWWPLAMGLAVAALVLNLLVWKMKFEGGFLGFWRYHAIRYLLGVLGPFVTMAFFFAFWLFLILMGVEFRNSILIVFVTIVICAVLMWWIAIRKAKERKRKREEALLRLRNKSRAGEKKEKENLDLPDETKSSGEPEADVDPGGPGPDQPKS